MHTLLSDLPAGRCAAASRPPSRTLLKLVRPGDDPLAAALDEIVAMFPARFASAGAFAADPLAVRFLRVAPPARGYAIRPEGDALVTITFVRTVEAFRALGVLMGCVEGGLPIVAQEGHCAFESLGVMLDVSRNGVLRPEAVRRMIRHLALMGVNRLMLYTEDTYEVPGEPLFGYFRGGYTQAELGEIDDYAAKFDIEVVPCIQTLGHLEQALQWPAYENLKDTAGVLLAGDAETDAFVEKLIAAASAPFRTKRIHIGMDEAHGIGSGRYRLRKGLRPPFEILCEHLERTTATCRRLGLEPMIWSDMFFRLGSRNNDYYDREAVVTPGVVARVPADVDLVYWDYYHTDEAFFAEWISRHRSMGKTPIYAGGVWTWGRWWAQLPFTMRTLRAGMTAARRGGLAEAFVAVWGDDGMECDVFSALAGIQFFAELGYGEADAAGQTLAVNFRGSCDADLSAWMAAGDLDIVPDPGVPEYDGSNVAKWLLWHDPLLGFLDRHVPAGAPEHYARLAGRLRRAAASGGEDARLDFPAQVAAVLTLKSSLHLVLRPAYRAGDHDALRTILAETLPALTREVTALRELHERRWHANYRAFGWEVIERRYAGLLSRLDTLARRLRAHLENTASRIEELDCESVRIWPGRVHNLMLNHHRAATPSRIC